MKLLQFFFSNLISSQQKGSFIFRTSTPEHLHFTFHYISHKLNLCSISYFIKILIKIPAWLSRDKRHKKGTIEHLKRQLYFHTFSLPPSHFAATGAKLVSALPRR